jgi:hypothetical protein
MKRLTLFFSLALLLAACREGSFTDPFGGRNASISGVVTSSRTTQPIGGATIGVFTIDTNELVGSAHCDGITGQYAITGLRPGQYRFYVNYPGRVLSQTEVDLHEGPNHYDIAVDF